MEGLDLFIKDLALITIACAVVTIIFRKFNLPLVLGYILAGFLIGPNFLYLPNISVADNVESWADIGVVFLMFALGLEFSFKKISTLGSSAITIAMTVISCMIVVGVAIGKALGFPTMDAVFLGCMISLSSTMIIMKAYDEYGLNKKKYANVVMGTMVIEDVAGIFMLIILSTIAVGKGVSGLGISLELGKMIIFLIIWLVGGIFLIPTLLNKCSKLFNSEALLIVSLAICFGMVVISHLIGFSEALGAFLAGSILAGTVHSEKIEKVITPIKDLFGAVFFVSVGMMVDPHILVEYWLPIVIITVITIVGQMFFATMGFIFSGKPLRTAISGGFSMVQVGEFSFILASTGVALGAISDFLYPVIVCVSVITIITTPIFIKNSEKAGIAIENKLSDGFKNFLKKYTQSKKNSASTENDWKLFWKKYLIRMLICSATMVAVTILSIGILEPYALEYLPLPDLSLKILLALVTCVLLLIVASILSYKKNDIYIKLWIKSTKNRMPLAVSKVMQLLICVAFLLWNIEHYISIVPWWIWLVVSIALVILISRLDFIKSSALHIESKFVGNYNERLLKSRAKETSIGDMMSERLYISEFRLNELTTLKNIFDIYDPRMFDMRVIKIVRGRDHINLPRGVTELKAGDIIHLIGTASELEAFQLVLEADASIDIIDSKMPYKTYLEKQKTNHIAPRNQIFYLGVPIKKGNPFIMKTIKNSGFRDTYNAFIVGIERDFIPMVDPSIDTVIYEGDVLWVIGSEMSVEKMIRNELIEEV